MYSQGSSEETLGLALKKHADRDETAVATKLRHPMRSGPNGKGCSRKAVMTEIGHSLRRLGTDCVDLCQMHRLDQDTPTKENLEALYDLVRGGQGPLPRRLSDARLGVRRGAAPATRARVVAVRLDVVPLQAPRA